MKKTLMSLALLLLAVSFATAQTNNRRAKPKPLATPPITGGDATLIGPGGGFPGEVVIEPVARQTPDPRTETRPRSGGSSGENNTQPTANSAANQYDDKQKRVLLNLDILTRAEQRSESLRKQYFDMVEKENTANTRLSQIEYDIRPEVIERSTQMVGSMRPEELRESRRRGLEAERRNLQAMLAEIQSAKSTLSLSLSRSDQLVERLRARLEKEIEDSFLTDEDQ